MGADIIQAQYDQLEVLARRFGKQADMQTALQKQLQTHVERLRNGGWAGHGSAAFFAEMDGKVFPAVKRLIDALQRAESVTLQIGEIVQRAEEEAARPFGQTDRPGDQRSESGLRQDSLPAPTPGPTPTPPPVVANEGSLLSIENAINQLGDILKPIDWIAKSKTASKSFDETLKEIGRILNAVTGERGHIKMMSDLGDTLAGAGKVLGGLSDALALRDFARYYAGELTNQQIADTAIKKLVPIPILNDRVAAWMIANLPDPTGRWRGLVTPVE